MTRHLPVIECDNCGVKSNFYVDISFYQWPTDSEILDLCRICMKALVGLIKANRKKNEEKRKAGFEVAAGGFII